MSFTLMRTTERSPCQPIASSGLNGNVIVEMRAAPLHLHAPLLRVALLGAECIVDLRNVEHRGIEQRVRAHEPLLRQRVARVGRFDGEHGERRRAVHAPHRAARNHDVVAGGEAQMPEVAVELPLALVDEQQLIAIGVAHEMAHLPAALCQNRTRTEALASSSGAVQGLGLVSTRAKSNACGRRGPSNDVQPVGGCRWCRWAAGPKNPSLLISRSNVPAGMSACAWREAMP